MRSVFCLRMAFRQVLLSIQSLMLSKREDRWRDKSCNGAGRFFARSQGEQGRVLADSLWDQQGVTFLYYFDLFLNHFHPFLSFIHLYVLVQLSTCQGSLVLLSVVFLLSLPVLLFLLRMRSCDVACNVMFSTLSRNFSYALDVTLCTSSGNVQHALDVTLCASARNF